MAGIARTVEEYVLLSHDEYEKMEQMCTSSSKKPYLGEQKVEAGTEAKPVQAGAGAGKLKCDHDVGRMHDVMKRYPLLIELTRLRREGFIKWDKSGQLLDEAGNQLGPVRPLAMAAMSNRKSFNGQNVTKMPGYDWFIRALVIGRVSLRRIKNESVKAAIYAYKKDNMRENASSTVAKRSIPKSQRNSDSNGTGRNA
jgi:hypothetical protein